MALRAARRQRLRLFLRVNRVPAVVAIALLVSGLIVKSALDAAGLREALAPALDLPLVSLASGEILTGEFRIEPIDGAHPADEFPDYGVHGSSAVVPVARPMKIEFERAGEVFEARTMVPSVLPESEDEEPAGLAAYDRLFLPAPLSGDAGVAVPELGFRVLGFADGADLALLRERLRQGDRASGTWTQVATIQLVRSDDGRMSATMRGYGADDVDFDCMSQVMAFHLASAAGGYLPTDRELDELRLHLESLPESDLAWSGLAEIHEYFESKRTNLMSASRRLLGQHGLGMQFYGPEASLAVASDMAPTHQPVRVLVLASLPAEDGRAP